jgi:dTDP-4-amino-4,6-dideoxygalactose transaminase
MVVTSDPEIGRKVALLRSWGQADPNEPSLQGFNYRMDGIQGAVLGVKLRYLDQWNAARRAHAARYDAAIRGPGLVAPRERPENRHVYHIYAARAPRRKEVQAAFQERGIEARVHYPVPVHLIGAWSGLGLGPGDLPHTERAAREVFSVPVHPELSDEQVERVCEALDVISTDPAFHM